MSMRILALAAAAGLLLTSGAHASDRRHAERHHAGDHHDGDAAKGKVIFAQQCMLCHSTVAGQAGAGPSLNGVVGRKAATGAGFPAYTRALKGSNLVWTADNLDKFLAGPGKLVPGTAMPISVSQDDARKNIIAYLASLKK